jgi:hypothetical protein
MELGEIQKAWIKSLRENGHRQYKNGLGFKESDDEYFACCLGEGLCVLKKFKGENIPFIEGVLQDGGDKEVLARSYEELGLINSKGELKESIVINGIERDSLAELNDLAFSWAEIADYIEQNPENVFTKSV